MAQETKKKNWKLMLAITLPLCQYVASHTSGWLKSIGEFDIMQMEGYFDYYIQHPLDLFSFNPIVYLFVYACGFAVYFHILFSRKPPQAELKGIEHGSNRFMTKEEVLQFTASRTTPNFPYAKDIRNPGVYQQKGGGKK